VQIKCVCATRATVHSPFSLLIRIINSRSRQCSQLKLYVNDLQKLISLQRREHYLLITATSSREVWSINEGKWEKTSITGFLFVLQLGTSVFSSGRRIIFSWKIFFLETKNAYYLFLLEKWNKKSHIYIEWNVNNYNSYNFLK